MQLIDKLINLIGVYMCLPTALHFPSLFRPTDPTPHRAAPQLPPREDRPRHFRAARQGPTGQPVSHTRIAQHRGHRLARWLSTSRAPTRSEAERGASATRGASM